MASTTARFPPAEGPAVTGSADQLLSFDGLVTGEKVRGAVASGISGTLAVTLNFVGVTTLGLSPQASAVIFLYALGGLMGYCVDIVLAKHSFIPPGSPRGTLPQPLPYRAIGKRLAWLVHSFAHRSFFRFIIAGIIEVLTGYAMLDAAIRTLDRNRVLVEHAKMRNACVAVAVAVTTFMLFGNILRFDWAYNETSLPMLNIVVLAWMALTMLGFSQLISLSPPHEPELEPAARAPAEGYAERHGGEGYGVGYGEGYGHAGEPYRH